MCVCVCVGGGGGRGGGAGEGSQGLEFYCFGRVKQMIYT